MARIRNAPAPSRRKIGTPSRNAMSSSMVIVVLGDPRSRYQFIAAGFGDQDSGRGGILFDLLPQTINVGFQRVRGDARIIAPDFLQQRFARNRALAGAI